MGKKKSLKHNSKYQIINEIKKYIHDTETPGYERTYAVGEFEIYRWKGSLYIVNGYTDLPLETYSEEKITELLNKLKSSDYIETKWSPKEENWIKINHKAVNNQRLC